MMAGMPDQGAAGEARHCVVTGALGGIGAAVVAAARDAGYRVTAVDQGPHGHSSGADAAGCAVTVTVAGGVDAPGWLDQ